MSTELVIAISVEEVVDGAYPNDMNGAKVKLTSTKCREQTKLLLPGWNQERLACALLKLDETHHWPLAQRRITNCRNTAVLF